MKSGSSLQFFHCKHGAKLALHLLGIFFLRPLFRIHMCRCHDAPQGHCGTLIDRMCAHLEALQRGTSIRMSSVTVLICQIL